MKKEKKKGKQKMVKVVEKNNHPDVAIADFLFEAGILAQTPRSWTGFLGSGKQSVAEHLNRVTIIGYVLACLEGSADPGRTMSMCVFHDFAEARTSDLNYVHQQYATVDEEKAIHDFVQKIPFGGKIKLLLEEYKKRDSLESKLAKDADNLELILTLKEQVDIGNERARSWIASAVKRLKTPVGQKVAEAILATESDHWWFSNKEDDWWVHRNGKLQK